MSERLVSSAYANYIAWKDWRDLFAYSREKAVYFKGETRDLKISGADVLEIGFGDGEFLAYARDAGARIVGAEIIPELLVAARTAGFSMLEETIEREARRAGGQFDTIVAFDVFEHLPETDLLCKLDAASALLRVGGRLMLRFPNAQSPFGLAAQNGDPTHRIALSGDKFSYYLLGRPLKIIRYGEPFAPTGNGFRQKFGRTARAIVRALFARILNFVYGLSIPWGPVVILVLEKTAGEPGRN